MSRHVPGRTSASVPDCREGANHTPMGNKKMSSRAKPSTNASMRRPKRVTDSPPGAINLLKSRSPFCAVVSTVPRQSSISQNQPPKMGCWICGDTHQLAVSTQRVRLEHQTESYRSPDITVSARPIPASLRVTSVDRCIDAQRTNRSRHVARGEGLPPLPPVLGNKASCCG